MDRPGRANLKFEWLSRLSQFVFPVNHRGNLTLLDLIATDSPGAAVSLADFG